MSNKSPIFPMPEPHHFSDYGFDPQIDYFQVLLFLSFTFSFSVCFSDSEPFCFVVKNKVLEEARKHKRESTRPIDSIHFKLQKPISKDESKKTHKAKKKRWWRSALLFFKWKWVRHNGHGIGGDNHEDVHLARARAFRASLSGPVYFTESRSGSASATPYRSTSRPSSGPLAGTFTPPSKGEVDLPYLSLRELNTEQQQQQQRISTSSMPLYLVT